jgi:hypothetical protein
MSTADIIRSITEVVTAICGVGTLSLALLIALKGGAKIDAIVTKTDDIHTQTIDILKQTNGIMEASMGKTEVIAHAAGMAEGLSKHAQTAASLAPAAAAAAALLLETAAQAAKEVAAKALETARGVPVNPDDHSAPVDRAD